MLHTVLSAFIYQPRYKIKPLPLIWRRDIIVGIVTGLRAGLPGFGIRAGRKDFSFLQSVQTGSEAQPAFPSISLG
jgi:hypothetical protein